MIVAGYQGVSKQREVTTLGRGGSDTTAVALAAALGADCEIYSDVDGVFSADPRVVPSAQKLDDAHPTRRCRSWPSAGAKVLNAQAVEFAREKGIVIHARSTHAAGTGTRVMARRSPTQRVKGVTASPTCGCSPTRGGLPTRCSRCSTRRRSRAATWCSTGQGATLVVVPLQDVHGPAELQRAKLPPGVTRAGRSRPPSPAWAPGSTPTGRSPAGPWRSRRALGAPISAAYASALQLTLVTDRAQARPLTRALHEAFIG